MTMKTTTNFEEFMTHVDWEELSIGEKQSFFEAAHGNLANNGLPFKVFPANDNTSNVILTDMSGDYGLILTSQGKISFPKWLEDKYMYGEDGYSYLSWLETIQKEDAYSFIKETTIHMLPLDECRIVKKIGLAYKARKRIHFATIIYKRVLTNEYNFKSKDLYLQQDAQMYPHDELDDAIFEAVQELYPDATISTETQMFDSEKFRQEILLKNQKKLSADFGIALEENFGRFHTTIVKKIFSSRLDVYCLPTDATIIFSNMTFLYRTRDAEQYDRLVYLIQNTLK